MATSPPRRSFARKTSAKDIPIDEAKRRVLDLIAQGLTAQSAMQQVGRTYETYRSWRKDDDVFRASVADLRTVKKDAKDAGRQPVPDFPEFCRDYLGEPLFPHQLRAYDIIEGNEPRMMHPAITFEPGDDTRIIMNFPPNHAKTVSFSINYAVWRIYKDPGISIAIISKSQGYAKKVLAGIKAKLTSRQFQRAIEAFGPEGGWRDPDQSWSATQIYVQGKYDDGDTEKEPTVEAIGIGGHIYGGRFDLIILDDVVDNENVHRHEDQVDWAMTILDSRLPPDGGLMLILGTRIAATDFYGELRKRTDEDEGQFFTYFAQPAVLEYRDGGAENWLPLWPWTNKSLKKTDVPESRCFHCYAADGECDCGDPDYQMLYPRWTGPRLSKKRYPLGERRWSLVWQQQQIPDDATFDQNAIEASINRLRKAGPLSPGAMGHPESTHGLYVIGGLDPATVGNTAMVVTALDRFSGKRIVLDGFNKAGCSPTTMREKVKELTQKHGINEWVIERNAFQRFLTQDPELKKFLQAHGCRLTEHYTTANKVDPDFGVMSLAPLFESCGHPQEGGLGGKWKRTPDTALIELPSDASGWVSDLIKQLITWEPSGLAQGTKTDLVMALWFTDIAAKRLLGIGQRKQHHLDNPFASRAQLKRRAVINIAEFREAATA